MHKAAQAVTAINNVVTFPRRATVARSKGLRKASRGKASNVLPFTGLKRVNYDAEAKLPAWKDAMISSLSRMMVKVQSGEVTGLAIICAYGVPSDELDPAGNCTLSGLYRDDVGFFSRSVDALSETARDYAEKHPSRPM
ncbi:hypothetical protein J2789_005765 [Variovorax paradoxus]|uniref:hypothetical protein n=1 Tax=Variovorax atrisoli TaxID=3394203 RepID=UPI00119BF290|nr:hypothetical protein [Variovorax paradoxus]MDR6523075.1 hypothetical protein [Variovorax paradoxus]